MKAAGASSWPGRYEYHIMGFMRWLLQHRMPIAVVFLIIVLIVAGIWFWGVLVGYVNPGEKGATARKDVVQAFALIVAGVVGFLGGLVGIANLQTSRRNLHQQRDLEEQRAQEDALQTYFEQVGKLLTGHNLINTDREDIRLLAQAQTLTVLARLDGSRKGSLVRFLHGAELINKDKVIVSLKGANLRGADLGEARLKSANLNGAILIGADLSWANLIDAILIGANLSDADLSGADLSGAIPIGANLSDAIVTKEQLARCKHLAGATMPDGQKYEDWRETRPNFKDAFGGDPSRVELIGADFRGVALRRADLSDVILWGATLVEADLSSATLKKAELHNADLEGAILRRATLMKANLYSASLKGADLSGANLSGANLSGANLSGANLSGANLSGANLSRADLSGANLSGADLSITDLIDANLSGAIITEEQIHSCRYLRGAAMPNGQKYEDWAKDEDGRGENGENSGPS